MKNLVLSREMLIITWDNISDSPLEEKRNEKPDTKKMASLTNKNILMYSLEERQLCLPLSLSIQNESVAIVIALIFKLYFSRNREK